MLKPHFLFLFALLGCQSMGVPSDAVASSTPIPQPTVVSSPDPATSAKPVAFDKTFKLGQAEPVVFPDGLMLGFSVKSDSRCPANVNCAWAGEVQTVFSFTKKGHQNSVPVSLVLRGNEATLSYEEYKLTLFAVDPYPTHPSQPTSPVATVKVSISDARQLPDPPSQ